MNNTPNYGYNLPEYLEDADVVILNQNFTAIDKDILDVRQIAVLMYDSDEHYDTDDLVGYENPTDHHIRMFRCLEDNVTGVWDSTKWTNTNVAAELLRRSGGTEVEANPIGTATDTLVKIRIGNTIYAVSSGATALEDLTDVDLSNLTTGQILVWDGNDWVNSDPIGGASELSDLDDVSLTTPTEGQILTYDGEEWVNTDAPDVDVTKTATGNPIEISDGASAPLVKCVTAITGSQDLHGQDKPWVGGAGKNKLPLVLADIKSANTAGTWSGNKYTINSVVIEVIVDSDNNVTGIKVDGTTTASVTFTIYSGSLSLSENTYTALGANVQINGTTTKNSQGTASTFTMSSGDYISFIWLYFSTNTEIHSTFYPQIEVGQTATTFAPYSNICPITAYDEGEIEVRGKNLWDGDEPLTINSTKIVNFTLPAGTYTLSAECTSDIATTHAMLFHAGTGGGGSVLANIQFSNSAGRKSYTITLASDVHSIYFYAANAWTESQGKTTTYTDFQIEQGTTATDYEPYTSTTHTTTYPSAIYRGSEDVVNGEVTTARIVGDKSDLNGSISGTSAGGLQFIDSTIPFDEDVICNMLPTIPTRSTAWQGTTECISQDNNGKVRLYVNVTDYSDFVTKFADLQFVYPYVTTSSVTPTNLPIKSLNGYSHIESTTGDMEIEYIVGKYNPIIEIAEREIKTIDEMLTENIELSMVASQNYTSGELLIACGKIYRATANIASGSNLTVGTNVVKTTIEAEIARSGGGANYSTTEHVVGTWIDGSTVYERVLVTTQSVAATANNWASTEFPYGDISIIISGAFVDAGGEYHPVEIGNLNNYMAIRMWMTYTFASGSRLVIRYTKSS